MYKIEFKREFSNKYMDKNNNIGTFDIFSFKKVLFQFCPNWTIVQFKLVISFLLRKRDFSSIFQDIFEVFNSILSLSTLGNGKS